MLLLLGHSAHGRRAHIWKTHSLPWPRLTARHKTRFFFSHKRSRFRIVPIKTLLNPCSKAEELNKAEGTSVLYLGKFNLKKIALLSLKWLNEVP